MKKIFLLFVVAIVLSACNSDKRENYTAYGEGLSDGKTLNGEEFLSLMSMEDVDSASMQVEGKIIETCSKKGCWMTVDLGNGEQMRVTFKDYGFFVPKEGVEGKTVVFEGTATKVVTDVETLKHFAEDEGKTAEEIALITEPKKEISFVATGVAIDEVQE